MRGGWSERLVTLRFELKIVTRSRGKGGGWQSLHRSLTDPSQSLLFAFALCFPIPFLAATGIDTGRALLGGASWGCWGDVRITSVGLR